MDLALYRSFARARWPRSYVGKFLLTSFLGVHVPLIAVVCYVVARGQGWDAALPIVVVALLATLAGTGATLVVQRALLAPLLATARALEEYARDRTVPRLPTEHGDEAGRLMASAQHCVVHLDELLQLKNNLLAVLSHDARNPITSILCATQLAEVALGDTPPDVEELRQMNDIVQQSARRQLVLLNDLLTLARADTGTVRPTLGEVDVAALLAEVDRNTRLQAERKGVTLTVRAPRPGARVRLDASKTEQVVTNLVHNAIKFTPVGGAIELEGRLDDDHLLLDVSDTGIGMPPEVRQHLFRPFGAAQRAGTGDEPGTGLGLWICKTFTELQGGAISVDSEPGRGSRFRVRIPRSQPAGRAAEPLATV